MLFRSEVTRTASDTPESVRNLLPTLRDPDATKIVLVALPEATPVHEAARLQADLRRAGIEPFAWVVNQSLAPLAVRDPVLTERRAHEGPFLAEILAKGTPVALVPWLSEPPVGIAALARVLRG